VLGASRAAIQAHYDIGDDFYHLWLDPSMTYSCALWHEGDSLQLAQERKLDFHAEQACVRGARRVLDIGCGWGSLLTRLIQVHQVSEATGLTLSDSQADFVKRLSVPGTHVAVESWTEHRPATQYDAIVSIGAIEHFARPETSSDERVEIYRRFFQNCRTWLAPGGSMSIQTSAYEKGRFIQGAIASIFPESDLPRLLELVAALEGLFEIVSIRNDPKDYATTCRAWLARLRENSERASALVGDQIVRHYEAFLDAAARGFDAGVFGLLRLRLRRGDV
jgi:cyclopropane-fatty-acyl-phospholipid synthase